MTSELRDCPSCGAGATARVIYERFGTLAWWCVRCEYDWEAPAGPLAIGTTQREDAVASTDLDRQRHNGRAA